MKIWNVCLAAALLGATIAPVSANEVHPYVGVVGGYDRVTLSTAIGSGSKNASVYGGVAGVDLTLVQGSVIGIEGEVTGASTKESVTVGAQSASLKAGRDLYAGARFGFVLAPHVLAYAKGGYTNARASGRYTDTTGTYTGADNLNGWRIGGGAELAMQRFRVRIEYRYSDYGEFKYQGINTGVKVRRNQVVLGALLDL